MHMHDMPPAKSLLNIFLDHCSLSNINGAEIQAGEEPCDPPLACTIANAYGNSDNMQMNLPEVGIITST